VVARRVEWVPATLSNNLFNSVCVLFSGPCVVVFAASPVGIGNRTKISVVAPGRLLGVEVSLSVVDRPLCIVVSCFSLSTNDLNWVLQRQLDLLCIPSTFRNAMVQKVTLTLGISFRVVKWKDCTNCGSLHGTANFSVFVTGLFVAFVFQLAHADNVSFPGDLFRNCLKGPNVSFARRIEVDKLMAHTSS
jgi:hypothetical protein